MNADERAALQDMVRRGYLKELCGGHDGYQWRTVDVLAKSLSALDAAEAERDDARKKELRAMREVLEAVQERDAAAALLRRAKSQIEFWTPDETDQSARDHWSEWCRTMELMRDIRALAAKERSNG